MHTTRRDLVKAFAALPLVRFPDALTRDDQRRGVALISKLYASFGVTSACEADTAPEGLQGYQDARDSGELKYRAYCHMNVAYLDRYIAASAPSIASSGCTSSSRARRRAAIRVFGSSTARREPGKLADFAVLNQDPFTVDAERWQEIKVERTMLGGKWVYES
jgi:hypothetical protein